MMELLVSEDPLILDSLAIVHAYAQRLASHMSTTMFESARGGSASGREWAESPPSTAPAATLAELVYTRSENDEVAEFALAAIERAIDLYSRLIDESCGVSDADTVVPRSHHTINPNSEAIPKTQVPPFEVTRIELDDISACERSSTTSWEAVFQSRLRMLVQGMTIRQVADLTGSNRETVRRYLNGASIPSTAFVVAVTASFKVSADWLLGLDKRSGIPS